MTKILFLGGHFPDEMIEQIIPNSKRYIQAAADVLQKSIIKSLRLYFQEISIVSLPFVGNYPFRYTKAIISSQQIEPNHYVVGFNNIVGINFISRYIQSKKFITRWAAKESGEKYIIVYSLIIPHLKAAIEAKAADPSIKVCVVIPDLPQYMSGKTNAIYRFLKNRSFTLIKKYLQQIDSSIVLTEYMIEALHLEKKNNLVIESIFDQSFSHFPVVEKKKKKAILYSGTLDKRYGVMDLVHAFGLIKQKDYELWICGDGDSREAIEEICQHDKRIIYKGKLPRNKVLELQTEAKVLVNPRSNDGEYTKYSFPSKIMEYFASGTPCIINKLDGIPNEYYNYCFVIDGNSHELLAAKMQEVCNMPDEELKQIGQKAYEFVKSSKNCTIQGQKIYHLLNQ
ncbi:glycosyltransferase family 4 protein [Emticicia sp. 17c]|uniref:glycosyltransferase family 4 protein n=1 Tax=Emticicia sp. 17c TaxID=3127704 RepID=UPI00301E1764